MTKFVIGVTWTPEEKNHMGVSAISGGQTPGGIVKEHAWSALLSDGTTCPVSYRRYNPRLHLFEYGPPLGRRLYLSESLEGGVPVIEEKAKELDVQAFKEAQLAEQKEMRRKTPPTGSSGRRPVGEPQMKAKEADRCAGLYCICVRFTTGRLMPLGTLYETPERAEEEFRSGRHDARQLVGGQRLVIGICNRLERRWAEPRFLTTTQRSLVAVMSPEVEVEEEEEETEPMSAEERTAPSL